MASACWEFKDSKSFSEIAEWLTANTADDIIEYLSASEKSETRILINAVAGIKAEQLASLMNELRNTLIVFATDPVLRKLSGNGTSIVPQDIEENWIYLVLPESKLQVYSRYLSLIVSQFTRYLTQRPIKATKAFQFQLFPEADNLVELKQNDYISEPSGSQLTRFNEANEKWEAELKEAQALEKKNKVPEEQEEDIQDELDQDMNARKYDDDNEDVDM